MSKWMTYLFAIPRSLIFNIRVFGLKDGLKIPVLLGNNIKIGKIYRNCIELKEVRFGVVKIGINSGSEGCAVKGRGVISVEDTARLTFLGRANFARGVRIIATQKGQMIFGQNFSANRNCTFSCDAEMRFGDDVLLGWNVNIRTSDGHKIININEDNKWINTPENVYIGNHCWICAESNILKGCRILDNVVIGYGSLVSKSYNCTNVILAGKPAKIVKENINWIR